MNKPSVIAAAFALLALNSSPITRANFRNTDRLGAVGEQHQIKRALGLCVRRTSPQLG